MILKKILFYVIVLSILPISFSSVLVDVLQTDPAPLVAGEYGDITVQLENVILGESGEDILSLELSISQNPYIMYIQSDGEVISNLQAGQIATRTLRVYVEKNTPQGFFDIPLIIKRGSEELIYEQRIYVEGFEQRVNLSIGKVDATPNILVKDSTYNTLQVEIVNMGQRDAKLVTAYLQTNNDEMIASYSFSEQDSLGTIVSGESVIAEFVVDVLEINSSFIESSISLKYQEEVSSNEFEIVDVMLPFRVELSPVPDFEIVDIEVLSDFRHETTENAFKLVLKNVGLKKANDVRVRVVPDKSYPFIFEEATAYAQSEVNVGEEIEVMFKTEVTSGDAKEYQLRFDIESLVNFDTYIQKEYATITTVKGEDNFNMMYIIIVVLIICGFTGVIGYRKFMGSNEERE